MSQPMRSGVHAWDERDARSIASNTLTYRGALFPQPAAPEEIRVEGGIPARQHPMIRIPAARLSGTARLACSVLSKIRPRNRAPGAGPA